MKKKLTKRELFLELAKPNNKGISRWIYTSEFVGKYKSLTFGNGGDFTRKSTSLAKTYIIETDKSKTKGNKIDCIRLNGKQKTTSSQQIKSEIIRIIKKQRCVILDVSDVQPDHKNGRKANKGGDLLAMNTTTQKLEQFQPLSETANYAKRQHCKECSKTNNRFDAKKLGYPISFYKGTIKHTNKADGSGCVGCFWFDPLEFRKHLTKK
jgi:hypothetical protein